MAEPEAETSYQYDDLERAEVQPFVPSSARRILDVGCGLGGFAAAVKAASPAREVWGVEASPEAAAVAGTRLDNVIAGYFPDAIPADTAPFDCIVFNDVLEHIEDPWSAVRSAVSLVATGGCVVASIPNVRNIEVVWDLVRRGRWEYTTQGILDRTHLRFFTRSSIRELFERDYQIDELRGINFVQDHRVGRWLHRVLRSKFDDFLALQFVVVARPK